MKREIVIGSKYFLKDKVLDESFEVQITEYNEDELTYKRLSDMEFQYREMKDVEILNKVNDPELENLHKNEIFSINNDLIKAIVGRQEMFDYTLNEENPKKFNFNPEFVVLISVTDPSNPELRPDVASMFKDVLHVSFWDIEEQIGSYSPLEKDVAKHIKDFILKNKNEKFVVHCEAGISRSAGVGMAIENLVLFEGDKYLYKTSKSDIRNHARYFPNLKVYDMIMES